MELGFVSAILPELSFEQVLEEGRAANYRWVELMCWPPGKAERRYAGVTHLNVDGFTADDAARAHDLTAKYGVGISSLGYYPNILSPDAEESRIAVEHMKKLITAARLLGLRYVTGFIGRDWHKSVDENWPRFLELWRPLIHFAEDEGIFIGIENCPMLFTADEWPGGKNLPSSPAIWRRMFADIPSGHFGLNYDPSHLLWQGMDYIGVLKEFKEKIFRVHLKDAAVDRNKLNEVGILAYPLQFHSPRLPGRGDIDWKAFLLGVKAIGYDGPVVVEVEDKDYEKTLADRKAALKFASDYIGSLGVL